MTAGEIIKAAWAGGVQSRAAGVQNLPDRTAAADSLRSAAGEGTLPDAVEGVLPNATDGTLPDAGGVFPDPLPDSLSGAFPDSLSCSLPDSLPGLAETMAGEAAVTAADVYGPNSAPLADDALFYGVSESTRMLTDSVWFSLAALACFLLYCLILRLYAPQAAAVLSSLGNSTNMEKLTAGHNNLQERFLNMAVATGMFALCIVLLRVVDNLYGNPAAGPDLSSLSPALCATGIAVAVAGILLLQVVILETAGIITGGMDTVRVLLRMRTLVFASGTMLLVIPALVFAFAEAPAMQVAGWVVAIAAAALYGFCLWKVLILFRERKVSIFFWFLYLCGVELIPVSLPVLLALKNI